MGDRYLYPLPVFWGVAQLVRAVDFESTGPGFESQLPTQSKGRLPERPNGLAWKAMRGKTHRGSNPLSSATLHGKVPRKAQTGFEHPGRFKISGSVTSTFRHLEARLKFGCVLAE